MTSLTGESRRRGRSSDINHYCRGIWTERAQIRRRPTAGWTGIQGSEASLYGGWKGGLAETPHLDMCPSRGHSAVDQGEEPGDQETPPKTTLLHEALRRTRRQNPNSAGPGPEPSCVSMSSMDQIVTFKDGERRNRDERPDSAGPGPEPSGVSMSSMNQIVTFKDGERRNPDERPDSAGPGPEPSGVSMSSMDQIVTFKDGERRNPDERPESAGPGPEPSGVSMSSMNQIVTFKDGQRKSRRTRQDSAGPGPVPRRVSMTSDKSKGLPIEFKSGNQKMVTQGTPGSVGPEPSGVSLNSASSLDRIITFKGGQRVDQQKTEVLRGPSADLDSIFTRLEENIIRFVKDELKNIQKVLSRDDQEGSKGEDKEVLEGEEAQRKFSRQAFLKITENFLRLMKQEDLANCLRSRTRAGVCRRELKSNLKKKFQCLFEGVAKAGSPILLNQIFTELYITEGGAGDVNEEHEVRQIETAFWKSNSPETPIRVEDLFNPPPGRSGPIRRVMTKGVAGIGKTVLTQKFTLDWAEDQTCQDIHFTFPFTFRALNLLKHQKFSLVELVHHFFTETKEAEICKFGEFQVIFIFDGLDECRIPLDFTKTEILTDVTESTSMQVLLTNLIRGNLLPSACVWITTRPAAAGQVPPDCVDLVTEVRGFTDPQKEEYFRKRFKAEKETATRIISHIQASRSLHIMCHIPVFCWITSTVLEDLLKSSEGGDLPKTLTEMYIHFLVVLLKLKNVKFHEGHGTDPHWSPENLEMIRSLGKLAFEQLQKGNLIFYESDLRGCGFDIRAASVYSGVFTQIFKEERGLYQDKVFCFIHLSVQEFLAALHVHLTFISSGANLMSEQPSTSRKSKLFRDRPELRHLHQSAVDQALLSPNGHLDLFLRFLLGLSIEDNQRLLQGLLPQIGNSFRTNQKTVEYIKKTFGKSLPVDRSINLFHCLNELKDASLVEEIQQSLRSGPLSSENLSPAQWSALVFILLSSGRDLQEFDLKKYSPSEEALLRLLPVVKASNKVLLSGCNLSERSCEALSSVLSSQSSSPRHLDLSTNDLKDSGVMKLCRGLQSPHCPLETLSLAGCLVSEEGCASLAFALDSNPSHLRDLDLSYNHPGDSGEKVLSEKLQSPDWRLDTLRLDHGGEQRLRPGLRKYSCELELDPNTVNRELKLLEDQRTVTNVSKVQSYPDHPDRFDFHPQLLCGTGLSGLCYWEVKWKGDVLISVSYRGIRRKGDGPACWFGANDQSWSLSCSDVRGYSVRHNKRETYIHSSSVSHRVSVFVDCPAGTLSFYRVSSDSLIHLHTFRTTFTETLYPGFSVSYGSSASLVSV